MVINHLLTGMILQVLRRRLWLEYIFDHLKKCHAWIRFRESRLAPKKTCFHTADKRNPANQWRLVPYPMIYQVWYMDVSENSGFSPQIIHFNRVFHYKPSILGVFPPFFGNPHISGGELSPDFWSINSTILGSGDSHAGMWHVRTNHGSSWLVHGDPDNGFWNNNPYIYNMH